LNSVIIHRSHSTHPLSLALIVGLVADFSHRYSVPARWLDLESCDTGHGSQKRPNYFG
jgi:hypothetical protein